MRVWTIALLALVSLAGFAWGDPETVQIEGEVVDMSCFTSRGARGESHQKCASNCLNRGLPAGLVSADGELVTIVAISHSFREFAAKTVKLEGQRKGHTILPEKMWVWKDENWHSIELKHGSPKAYLAKK